MLLQLWTREKVTPGPSCGVGRGCRPSAAARGALRRPRHLEGVAVDLVGEGAAREAERARRLTAAAVVAAQRPEQDRALDLREREGLEHDRAVTRDRLLRRLFGLPAARGAGLLRGAPPGLAAAEQALERTTMQTQHRRRLALVAVRAREDAADVHPLVLVERRPRLASRTRPARRPGAVAGPGR